MKVQRDVDCVYTNQSFMGGVHAHSFGRGDCILAFDGAMGAVFFALIPRLLLQ